MENIEKEKTIEDLSADTATPVEEAVDSVPDQETETEEAVETEEATEESAEETVEEEKEEATIFVQAIWSAVGTPSSVPNPQFMTNYVTYVP